VSLNVPGAVNASSSSTRLGWLLSRSSLLPEIEAYKRRGVPPRMRCSVVPYGGRDGQEPITGTVAAANGQLCFAQPKDQQ
jgi:hypothetical protein